MNALIDFDKPLIAAVQAPPSEAEPPCCRTVTSYTRARARSSRCLLSILLCAGIWIELLGSGEDRAHPGGGVDFAGIAFRCQARRGLGFVTQVVSDQDLLATATETARKLAAKPAGALQAARDS